ncbi:MAG: hypothetical protein AAGD18_13040 [Actinomycetota bacterium]
MSSRRVSDWWSTAAVLVGALLLLVGVLAIFVRDNVLDAGEFAARGVSTLDDDEVRTVIAEEAVDTLIEAEPDLVAIRPLLLAATDFAIDTQVVADIVRFGLVEAHSTLLSGSSDALTIRLADLLLIVNAQVRAVVPEVGDALPADLTDALVEFTSGAGTTEFVALANDIRDLALVLPLLALAAYGFAWWRASDRRTALVPIGVSVAGVGTTLVLGEAIGRAAVERFSTNGASVAIWDAFVSDLTLWGLVLFAAGVVVAAGAASLIRPVEPTAVIALARRMVFERPATGWGALGRVVVSGVLGLWLVTDPLGVVDLTVRLVGLALLSTVVGQVLAHLGDRGEVGAELERAEVHRDQLAGWVVAGIVFVVAIGGLGWLAVRSIGSGADAAASGVGCNGSVLLCDRRLDDVVIAATHNSNSAAADGYLVANHSLGIEAQLDAGFRGLLIDTWYGIESEERNLVVTERVDTTGDERDRLVAELGEASVEAAEALRERQLDSGGDVELYLCHNLCELGSTRLDEELLQLRRWLVANPREVLVIFIQDELTPEDTEEAFEDAGLEPFLHAQDLDEPFPTLGEMIDSGRRVFVMAENDAGDVGWYHDGFAFTQETPFSYGSVDEFSCDENRGDTDSPLFLVNHFVTPALASEGEEANVASLIVDRVRECEEERDANVTMVAIDFFARGDVLAAVDELNGIASAE